MANQPIVGIIMGSDSDLNIMQAAADILKTFNIMLSKQNQEALK